MNCNGDERSCGNCGHYEYDSYVGEREYDLYVAVEMARFEEGFAFTPEREEAFREEWRREHAT